MIYKFGLDKKLPCSWGMHLKHVDIPEGKAINVTTLECFTFFYGPSIETTPELPAKGKKGKKDETVKGKDSGAKSGENNFVVKFSTC